MTPPKNLEERAFEFLEYEGEADADEMDAYITVVRLELQALREEIEKEKEPNRHKLVLELIEERMK